MTQEAQSDAQGPAGRQTPARIGRHFILDALAAWDAEQPLPCHMPGHKRGALMPQALRSLWGDRVARFDATELPGLDSLHAPAGCIEQSQRQAAEIFGAGRCFYLVNGTTGGLESALLSCCREKPVFVPRHVHRSVYYGLLLARARPIYLPVELDPETGLPLGVSAATLSVYLERYPDCRHLVLVNPTFQGITAEFAACAALAKAHGLTVLVDEAHGAHFGFHPSLPASALAAGADLTVQSWHKMLPVLTQGSALLVRAGYAGPDPAPFVHMLQTTSPSYLLMSSLEAGSVYMAESGPADIARSLEAIARLRTQLEGLRTLRLVWRPEWRQDPFKLYLRSDRLTGAEVDAYLRQKHAVYCEFAEADSVLLLLPLALDADWCARLRLALADLDAYSLTQPRASRRMACFYASELPEARYSLQEAFTMPREQIAWRDAAGRAAGDFILRYPPGIPALVPGEVLSPQMAELWRQSGGSDDDPLTVLRET